MPGVTAARLIRVRLPGSAGIPAPSCGQRNRTNGGQDVRTPGVSEPFDSVAEGERMAANRSTALPPRVGRRGTIVYPGAHICALH